MRKNLWLLGALFLLALVAGLHPAAVAEPVAAAPAVSTAPAPDAAPLPPISALANPAAPGTALPDFLAGGAQQPTWKVVYYCPELPADCCRTGRVGNCIVCVQGGCY